jgi:hypothetical protein
MADILTPSFIADGTRTLARELLSRPIGISMATTDTLMPRAGVNWLQRQSVEPIDIPMVDAISLQIWTSTLAGVILRNLD